MINFYDTLKNAPKLKTCLERMIKKELQKIVKNHNYDLPEDTRQVQILGFLNDALPKSFLYDLENTLGFQESFSNVVSVSEGIGIDPFGTQNMPDNIAPEVKKILDLGYCFLSGNSNISIPRDLLFLYKRQSSKDASEETKIEDIEFLATVATNLYGYCELEHVLTMYRELLNGNTHLRRFEGYIRKIIKESGDFKITFDRLYIYHNSLDEKDLQLFIKYDAGQEYYMPNDEDLCNYQEDILSHQAFSLWHDILQNLIIRIKSNPSYPKDILFLICVRLRKAVKLGYGIHSVLEILEEHSCAFRDKRGISELYYQFLELDQKTRKWILRGNFISDIQKNLLYID
jgi:hypothetical protein